MDELTILGAYNVSIQNFISRKPDIKILIATPIFREGANTAIAGKTLAEVCVAIESLARKYGIPVINMMNEGMINDYNKATFLNVDGLHPSAAGGDIIDKKFASFILSSY